MRDGFPTTLLDFVWEMGRCGRSMDPLTNQKQHELFQILLSMNLFVCLVEMTHVV